MDNQTDNTICSHGVSFDDDCDKCEITGLEESLSWMRAKVERDEKRLAKLKAREVGDNLSKRKVLWPPKIKGTLHRSTVKSIVRKVLHDKDSSKAAKAARGSALGQ